ncbi:MAG: segregation/condensation protein A [Candidatus Moraniibacteriota bacterium]|nr:MAG: segregation/condensation protein A [Candidatus Moranbacteria bacterium]
MYQVRLEQFEGPLPLLLSLIEKEKLDVTRLALSIVADQYLEHIAQEDDVALPHLSQFLSVASRLLLLKSRALLPVLSFTEEEEESIEDLEWRLREYKRYKEASIRLGSLFLLGHRGFHRESFVNVPDVFALPSNVSAPGIRDAFSAVLGSIPLPVSLDERIVEEVVTLEERVSFLESRIEQCVEAAFSDIAAESRDRIEVVVSFLALLELVRRRTFKVNQGELFGEIRFRKAVNPM